MASKKRQNGERLAKLKKMLKDVSNKLGEVLYPEDITCDACGDELCADTRYRLCADCMQKLPFVASSHKCLVCGVPLAGETDYCNRCQYQKSEFVKNRSPLVYDGLAKKMVFALKFGKKKYIATTLGALMADEYLKCGYDAEIVVPVPMSEKEEKARGFNQSYLLAVEVATRLKLPMLDALKKVKDTSAQKQLLGKEREENLKDAFKCVFEEVKGRKILLVDDVFTTGATANECSRALLKAKAREVSVLTACVTKLKMPVESGDGKTDRI